MAGTDTIHGIAFQQAAALLACIDVVEDPGLGAMRVEGAEDVVDFETFRADGTLDIARQAKTRAEPYTWGKGELLEVVRRWLDIPGGDDASFEFLTDGSLGPSGIKVREALRAAGEDDFTAIKSLLGKVLSATDRTRLARAKVISRAPSVRALFNEAEHRLVALLPAQPTVQQAFEVATRGINALYRSLFEHGGERQPDVRVLNRDELADILGVDLSHVGDDHWDVQLQHEYLAALATSGARDPLADLGLVPTDLQPAVLRPLGASAPGGTDEPLPLGTLLESGTFAVLAASTGAGKSTALRSLRSYAASARSVVIVVPSEAYTPGRLAAAVASALGQVLKRPVGVSIGREALADPTVTVAIDGASEMPAEYMDALAKDLRLLEADSITHAQLCLVGRDAGALRSIMPAAAEPAAYTLPAFDGSTRNELTHAVCAEIQPNVQRQTVLGIRLRVERALGAGASNPLLYTMGLSLVLQDQEPTSRADLYRQCIEGIAARSHVRSIEDVTPILGVVFAQLLTEGRRYTDRYTWRLLLAEATNVVDRRTGVTLDPAYVHEQATRAGLIVPIGATGILGAGHDSFADYLAGLGHGLGLVKLPTTLASADAERVVFAADVGGVSDDLADLVVRDLPFLSIRVAECDHSGFDDSAPKRIAELFEVVAGPLKPDPPTIQLWRDTAHDQTRVLACVGADIKSYWVTNRAQFTDLLSRHGITAVTGGPLAAAVRLWETRVIEALQPPRSLPMPHPRSPEEARAAVISHATDTAETLNQVVSTILSPKAQRAVQSELGPSGLHGYIGPYSTDETFRHYPLIYRPDHGITVALLNDVESAVDATIHTSVEALLDVPPAETAARRLREAIRRLTGRSWPRT